MAETSHEPAPVTVGKKRRWCVRRWVGVLCVGVLLYFGWRQYTYWQAVRTIEAAGYVWQHETPIDLIREDWRVFFRKETWEEKKRIILSRVLAENKGDPVPTTPLDPTVRRDSDRLFQAIRRLDPTDLWLFEHLELRNLQSLAGLTSVRWLRIQTCEGLQSLDGLQTLREIEDLYIGQSPALGDLSGLEGLPALECIYIQGSEKLTSLAGLKQLPALGRLYLIDCKQLRDIEAVRGLPSLRQLIILDCPQIPKETETALKVVLPNTLMKFE